MADKKKEEEKKRVKLEGTKVKVPSLPPETEKEKVVEDKTKPEKETKPEAQITQIKKKTGGKVLAGLQRGVRAYAELVEGGSYIVVSKIAGVGKGSGDRVRAIKLRRRLQTTRKKIKSIYTQIGGEICALESEGVREVRIEKGQLKKLVNQVKEHEKEMKETETMLLELQQR